MLNQLFKNRSADEPVKTQEKLLKAMLTPTLNVLLPYSFERSTMFSVINEIITPSHELRSNRVKFDFSRLNFANPSAITVLSNLIEYLMKKGAQVDYVNFNALTPGNKYLDDCGFFLQYIGRRIFPNSALRQSTLPLELIVHSKSFEWIEYRFSSWIENKVGQTNDSFTEIKACLSEVFNNIRDHSGEIAGSIFAQHYPKDETIMLSLSDIGKGIPVNVRKTFPNLSDEMAIKKAMEQGFTTKSTPVNQGMGLYYLLKSVVEVNRGEISINSLRGSVRCIPTSTGVRMLSYKSVYSYPGTLLQLTFNTNRLGALGVKEQFEW